MATTSNRTSLTAPVLRNDAVYFLRKLTQSERGKFIATIFSLVEAGESRPGPILDAIRKQYEVLQDNNKAIEYVGDPVGYMSSSFADPHHVLHLIDGEPLLARSIVNYVCHTVIYERSLQSLLSEIGVKV